MEAGLPGIILLVEVFLVLPFGIFSGKLPADRVTRLFEKSLIQASRHCRWDADTKFYRIGTPLEENLSCTIRGAQRQIGHFPRTAESRCAAAGALLLLMSR